MDAALTQTTQHLNHPSLPDLAAAVSQFWSYLSLKQSHLVGEKERRKRWRWKLGRMENKRKKRWYHSTWLPVLLYLFVGGAAESQVFTSPPHLVVARLHSWRLLGPGLRRYLHGHCTNSMRTLLHQPPVCFYCHSSSSSLCPPPPSARIWFSLHRGGGRASMGSTARRVLLVEDIEINRMVVRRLLSELNVSLEEAENGKIAVDFIKQGRTYDLIFMDREMPVMNGHEATKQLRSLGVTTPIIALSGDCLPCDRDLFIHAGANAFQAKPLSKIELIRILTEYGLNISHT